jgi:L-iditol 2-dehydrogenase
LKISKESFREYNRSVMMKAQVLEAVDQLVYKNVEMPECAPGWVIVKVMAAGVCGSDIPRIFTNGTYHFPTIPGHEFAGVVDAVREDASPEERAMVGKRVGIFPLIPCKMCTSCKNGNYEMCEHYNYLGSRCNGGFAEYAAVPLWNLIELPEEVSFEQAAMLEPISVALHGIKRAKVKKGDTVAIFGTGTIGLLMAQWCRLYGARKVLLIGTRQEQCAMAEMLGFAQDDFCITKREKQSDVDWVLQKTKNIGADVTIECVGGNETIENAILSSKAGGRVLLTGNPKADVQLDKNVYWRILRKQLEVTGTWNSGYTAKKGEKCDWTEAVEALKQKHIMASEMITHRTTLDKLQNHLVIMRDKSQYTNKIMVKY